MGQSQSKDKNSISQQGQQQNTINHPKFTTATLNKDNDLITIVLPIQNQTDFYTWEKNLNTLTQLDDQTFLLPKAYQFQKKSICGTSGTLKIQFDDFRFILHDEIENRRNYNKHFQEQEIWYLLYSLVISLNNLNKLNKRVGDIRPKNIFINDSGQLKVTTLYSWPNQKTNVQKTSYDKIITFIAPQQMQQIQAGKVQKIIDRFLAQSFSIGLTVLNTGLLDKVQNVYNLGGLLKFDNSLLQKKLNKWLKLTFQSQQKHQIVSYSNPLKEIVLGLCEPDPKNRISAIQVYKWLKPHEQSIFNLQSFQVNRPPVKKIRINYDVRQNNKLQQQQNYQPIFNNRPNQSNFLNKLPHGNIISNPMNNFPDQSKNNFSNPINTALINTSQKPNMTNNFPIYQNNQGNKNIQPSFVLNDKINNYNNSKPTFQTQQGKVIQLNHTLHHHNAKINLNQNQQIPSNPVFQLSNDVKKYEIPYQINNKSNTIIKKQEIQSVKTVANTINSSQQNNNNKQNQKISLNKTNYSNGDDFLKRINQQLQKSKMMYH